MSLLRAARYVNGSVEDSVYDFDVCMCSLYLTVKSTL